MSSQSECSADPSQRYLSALAEQLAADGCAPWWEQWPSGRVLLGRRTDFRIQWVATRLHLFTIAVAVPDISTTAIESFTQSALQYAKEQKGGLPRGLQTGIALFPCLVSERVEPAASAWAEAQQRVGWAIMARPVVVDPAQGVVSVFRRSAPLGWIYAPYLRRKLALYFDGALQALDRNAH